jgi:hypothetical protein
MEILLASLGNADFPSIMRFFITLFRAAAMHILSLYKGHQGSMPFLKRLFPGHNAAFYYRVDFVLIVICGAVIGTISFGPSSPIQALAAGFGWGGAINTLTNVPPTGKEIQ